MKTKRQQFLLGAGINVILLVTILVTMVIFNFNKSNTNASSRLDFSQKQLLLLNNYEYLANSAELIPIKDNINSLKTDGQIDKSKIELTASGIRPSDMVSMLKTIEEDSLLSDLVPVDSIETDIRAVCYVPKNKLRAWKPEAVLVFLGTKPIENAWLDCLQGSYQTDTALQQEALNFYLKLSKKYKITTVTGHSKGGNLSQYITLTNGDNIRNCVSFDGQGFSDIFIEKYNDSIQKHSAKITTIASYKEPVHMLLTDLSGETLNIKTNDEVNPLTSHVSSILYDESYFDENGNYKEELFTEPTKLIQNVQSATNKILNTLDKEQIENITTNAAPYITSVVTLLQEAMEHEDESLFKAIFKELQERNEDTNHPNK